MPKPATILIVDDLHIGRLTLEELLTPEGHRVVSASSGAEGIECVSRHDPDLVLLDVMMPEMDGFEVCRRLRSDPRHAELPIIMVTALDDRESRLLGIESGADDFISKPFDRSELCARIRTIVRLNRYRLLNAERDRFERLFQLSPEGISLVTADGVVEIANHSMRKLLGPDAKSPVAGRDFAGYIATDRREEFRTVFESVVQGGDGRIYFRTDIEREDGTVVPCELSVTERRDGDSRDGVQIIARDLTERVRLEAALLQAHRMEGVARMARGVAHDFGNLLAAVTISARSLKRRFTPDSPEMDALDNLTDAAEHGMDLARQLRLFGRDEDVTEETMDVNAEVKRSVKIIGDLLESIDLEFNLDPDVGRIRANRGQIQQVLMNLTINAKDAMPEGGLVRVSSANVVFREGDHVPHPGLTPGEYVLIEVADTGSGVPPDILPRIFEPFFTTKGPGKGTGLGLSIVYSVVHKCGGGVDVCGEPGAGATFRVYLPCAR